MSCIPNAFLGRKDIFFCQNTKGATRLNVTQCVKEMKKSRCMKKMLKAYRQNALSTDFYFIFPRMLRFSDFNRCY